MIKVSMYAVTLLGLASCSSLFPGGPPGAPDSGSLPKTTGEIESGHTYVPIDPFSVDLKFDDDTLGVKCKHTRLPQDKLLDALPDNAIRMLIERFDASGEVSYGVSKAGAKGESYRVTVDYISADTINVKAWIAKSGRSRKGELLPNLKLFSNEDQDVEPSSVSYQVSTDTEKAKHPANSVQVNIPVYVGVGLRVSANVQVIGAKANISGIGIIGAEAEAEKVRGSLVVQTLGVNGKSIAAALPIQSELNRTTAQNAIVAVGSIKALLYAPETIKSPRIVGIYLPFPGGKPLVNALISEISENRPKWVQPCPT